VRRGGKERGAIGPGDTSEGCHCQMARTAISEWVLTIHCSLQSSVSGSFSSNSFHEVLYFPRVAFVLVPRL